MENKILLIYHNADVDGLMSGYLLQKYFDNQKISYDIVGYNYEKDADWMHVKQMYSEYWFVDVTPTKEWFEKICQTNIKVNIFDHHKNRYEILYPISVANKNTNIEYRFASSISGCEIFANYCFQDFVEKIYRLINIVSLYDTWKFVENSGVFTKEEILNVVTCLQQYTNLDDFSNKIDSSTLKELNHEGSGLVKKIISDNEEIIKNGTIIKINDNYCFIYIGYPNYWLTNKLFDINFDIDFTMGIIFNLRKNTSKISLRSQNDFDVTKLAKQYGGDGHKNAAGFSLNFNDSLEFIAKYLTN